MKLYTAATIFLCAFAVFSTVPAVGEEADATELRYSGAGTYYLVERSNWSKYIDGKYSGLTHRENRANLSPVPQNGTDRAFRGYFYILEETLRDMTQTARAVDGIVETAFSVSPAGTMKFTVDNGYPQLRGFPAYPEKAVRIGDTWQAEGTRVVDPRNDGKKSFLPLVAEYRFTGREIWRGMSVFRIQARYATRITVSANRKLIDPALTGASGSHQVDILVSEETGAAVMMLDRLDETFVYADGGTIRFKGSTAFFTDTPVPVDAEKLLPVIEGIIADRERKADGPDTESGIASAAGAVDTATASDGPLAVDTVRAVPFTVERTDQGVRLSVRDLRFAADSDALLGDEADRLDTVAETLRLVPGGRFLVEGHTASVGRTAGEKELSVRRAQKIVDEMTKRGLAADRFIFTGYGGTKPVAGNDTEAGRAQNRRVEITILE